MIVNIKVLEGGTMPLKATAGAAAYDLYVRNFTRYHDYIEYDLGIQMEIPTGWCGKIYPRSSISSSAQILANSVGIVDSDYRGTVTARFYQNHGSLQYSPGDRCCQLMFERTYNVEFNQVDELSSTPRGAGGYGSTGA